MAKYDLQQLVDELELYSPVIGRHYVTQSNGDKSFSTIISDDPEVMKRKLLAAKELLTLKESTDNPEPEVAEIEKADADASV